MCVVFQSCWLLILWRLCCVRLSSDRSVHSVSRVDCGENVLFLFRIVLRNCMRLMKTAPVAVYRFMYYFFMSTIGYCYVTDIAEAVDTRFH